MPKLKQKTAKVKKVKPNTPVWKGPKVDGVTQSLLSSYLFCKERFRLKVIEGIDVADQFKKEIEYGNMFHLCEETNSAGEDWLKSLRDYCRELCSRYKDQQTEIDKWYNVCKVQFSVYMQYWKEHDSIKNRKSIMQEENFTVPYRLPNGTTVLLRGKWDGVDILGKGKKAGIYLREHKTKGDVKEEQLQRQLTFDLQTMIYLIALIEYRGSTEIKVKGVIYNVIRRPLSGGKGSIKPHKGTAKKPAETMDHYYNRLKEDYLEEYPETYFMRWKVEVTKTDIEKFKDTFLDPCLTELCDWYDDIAESKIKYPDYHYRTPYGIYNPLAQGRSTTLDDYLETGSMTGLKKTSNLFPELQ